jgi:homoserine dehydrogenase
MSAAPEHRVPHLAFQPDAVTELPILAMDRVESAYYLRITALDRPGVLADISRILADRNISIEAIQQQEPVEGQQHVPVIILTQRVIERSVNEAIRHMETLQSVKSPIVRLRVEALA